MSHPSPPRTARFGDFELDFGAYELRRHGRAVKLERRPMDLLILLIERRRQLVSRSEIVEQLWGKDVFVDVDTGINTAISKIRQALRDSPETPSFVETIPGRGYRFIAEVVDHAPPDVAQPPAAEPTTPEPSTASATPAADDGAGQPSAASGGEGAAATLPLGATTGAPGTASPAAGSRHAVRMILAAAVLVIVASTAALLVTRREATEHVSPVLLAVLPFENLSTDRERDYLADGITEETIAALGQVDPEHVFVIGRTTSMSYKGTKRSAAEIGRELRADYLVEGSIRTDAGRLRILSRLVRVADQVQVWSQAFDREPEGVLSLQRELSGAIAEQISRRLSPDRLSALARRQSQNAAAYDLYLRGRYFQRQATPTTNARAVEHFERAIALDPGYALAWSGLAFTRAASAINGDAPPESVGPLARAAADRAVAAEPDLVEVQTALGYVRFLLDWKWDDAEAALRRAIELDPRYAAAHGTLAHLLSQTGRHGEAKTTMQRALDLEPLEPLQHAYASQIAFQARSFAAAIDHARTALAIDSHFWIAHLQIAQAREEMGQHDAALDALRGAQHLSEHNSKALALRGHILARVGRTDEARDVLSVLTMIGRQRYVPPSALALVHAGLGDRDAMFGWLEKAYTARDVHLLFLPADPKWDPYRGDRRFADLLVRCGFVQARSTRMP